MKTPMICIAGICLASAHCAAASDATAGAGACETLRANMARYLVDQVLGAPVSPSDEVEPAIPPFDGEGTWGDIDYASRRKSDWPPKLHLRRMRALAAGAAPESRSRAVAALAAWVRLDPRSDNWWNQEIGTPKELCETMIILGGDLPVGLAAELRPILDRSKPGRTGQNRAWLAGIHAMKGMIYGDEEAVAAARRMLLGELSVRPFGKEGIQEDFSFHQHGALMQTGNYGLSFFREMTKWAVVFDGTPHAFPPEKLDLLERFFTDGIRWTLFNGQMDISACGRQVVGGYPAVKARSALSGAVALKGIGRLAGFDPARADDFEGARYFPCSGYLVRRDRDFFFALRMCTPEIIGAETVNDENLLARYTADGATYFRTAGNGYADALPLWDWRFIPGTTEAIIDSPRLVARGIRNGDGGGIRSKIDISSGTAEIEFHFRAPELSADKSWRCAGQAFQAVGSGITSQGEWPVVTTIDQRMVRGPVASVAPDGARSPLPEGDSAVPVPARIEHAGIRYEIAAADGVLHVVKAKRIGSWSRINAVASDEPIEGEVLLIYIDHGVRPSGAGYAYEILHEPSKESTP